MKFLAVCGSLYRHGQKYICNGVESLMKWIFLFPTFYILTCYFWWILVSSLRRIFRNRRKIRMFPQKLFPLNMVRSNWMEIIFEAWNAIDFTPNGMSNEHWSSMKKEFIILFYSMSERYFKRNESKGHSFCKQCLHDLQIKKTRYSSPVSILSDASAASNGGKWELT